MPELNADRLARVAALFEKSFQILSSRLSTKADHELLDSAKGCATAILAARAPTSPVVLLNVEKLCNGFRELYKRRVGTGELGARARLNEAVFLADFGFPERAIHLAGKAHAMRVREPYGTQLSCLPAHACVERFAQVWSLRKALVAHDDGGPSDAAALALQMLHSYAQQFHFFADEAFYRNQDHSLARYHYAIAHVLDSELGRCEKADADAAASAILDEMSPLGGHPTVHYMWVQYHRRIFRNFAGFPWDAKTRYPRVFDKLATLSKSAESIPPSRHDVPDTYYNWAPWLARGRNAASVATAILLAAAMANQLLPDINSAIDHLWHDASIHLLDARPSGTDVAVAFESGGLAALEQFGAPAFESGGLAALDQVSLLA